MLTGNFYKILSSEQQDATSFKSLLLINKEHEIFKGHFPGLPVLPGVCMMQMIKELLEENRQQPLRLSAVGNIKFLSLLNPSESPQVEAMIKYTVSDDGYYMAEAILSADNRPFFKMARAAYK